MTEPITIFYPSLDLLLAIVIVNALLYGIVAPIFCKSNINKLTMFDLFASIGLFTLLAINYAGQSFDFLIFGFLDASWWVAYIVYYVLIDSFMLWIYSRTYKIQLTV